MSIVNVAPALIVLAKATEPAPEIATEPWLMTSAPVALLRPPVRVKVPVPILVTPRLTSVAAVKAPAKVVLVLSAPMLSTWETPLLVMIPPVEVVSPAKEPKTDPAIALTSNSAPAATTRREAVRV